MWQSCVLPCFIDPYRCSHTLSVGHIAENCTSAERLCYNCRQPGHESTACPSPRTVATKQCYSCGGVGHIQAECPNLKLAGGGQKCYVSSRPRLTRSSPDRVFWNGPELWAVRTYCARVHWWCRWLCHAGASAWQGTEHVNAPSHQVLPMWWPEPHGEVSSECVLLSLRCR